jgi:hypothetical protein
VSPSFFDLLTDTLSNTPPATTTPPTGPKTNFDLLNSTLVVGNVDGNNPAPVPPSSAQALNDADVNYILAQGNGFLNVYNRFHQQVHHGLGQPS